MRISPLRFFLRVQLLAQFVATSYLLAGSTPYTPEEPNSIVVAAPCMFTARINYRAEIANCTQSIPERSGAGMPYLVVYGCPVARQVDILSHVSSSFYVPAPFEFEPSLDFNEVNSFTDFKYVCRTEESRWDLVRQCDKYRDEATKQANALPKVYRDVVNLPYTFYDLASVKSCKAVCKGSLSDLIPEGPITMQPLPLTGMIPTTATCTKVDPHPPEPITTHVSSPPSTPKPTAPVTAMPPMVTALPTITPVPFTGTSWR